MRHGLDCFWQIDISKCLNIKGCTCRNSPNCPSSPHDESLQHPMSGILHCRGKNGPFLKAHSLTGGIVEGAAEITSASKQYKNYTS